MIWPIGFPCLIFFQIFHLIKKRKNGVYLRWHDPKFFYNITTILIYSISRGGIYACPWIELRADLTGESRRNTVHASGGFHVLSFWDTCSRNTEPCSRKPTLPADDVKSNKFSCHVLPELRVCVHLLNCVRLLVAPQTEAHQTPLLIEFSSMNTE